MHIHIEAKHRAISIHPELWYPFLHLKKKEREREKEEKGENLSVHASIALLEGSLKVKNWSSQFNVSEDFLGFIKLCGLN